MLTIQVNTMNKIALLIQELIKYNHGDKKRIGHALKVHSYAKTIAILETVNEYDLFNLESAAILHDIGIKVCEEKYNSANGKLQEKEGPAVAREILESLDYKNITVLLDEKGEIIKRANVLGYPFNLLLDKDLNLIKAQPGHLNSDQIKQFVKE